MATMTSDSQTVATSWLTDEEILKLADKFDGFLHDVVVVDILRDYVRLRKLEKRKKKYEYARKYLDGDVSSKHYESPKTIFGDSVQGRMIVRREVGEWEEVNNER